VTILKGFPDLAARKEKGKRWKSLAFCGILKSSLQKVKATNRPKSTA